MKVGHRSNVGWPRVRFEFLFAVLLTACTFVPSPLRAVNSTNTAGPTAWSTPVFTAGPPAAASVTQTPVDPPAPPLSPSPTPAYSYLPALSEANASGFAKFDYFGGRVNSVAISPNGMYLAAAFDNGAGVLWNISAVNGWREWHNAPNNVFLANGPVSFNSDSSVLATGGTLIDLSSMKVTQEIPGTVAFHPNRNILASAGRTTLSLWNLDGSLWTLYYQQDAKQVASLAFSPDGRMLGEALHWGGGEGVNIWSVADHKLLYSFPPPEHNHPAHFNFKAYAFLAFSPDNQFVATGTKDQQVVRIWNLHSGELEKDLDTVVRVPGGGSVFDIECASFSQDAKVIVLAGSQRIMLKRISDGENIGLLNINSDNLSPDSYITACAASSDGKLLVVGDSGGDVSIWGVPASAP